MLELPPPRPRDPWLPEIIGVVLGLILVACLTVGTMLLLGGRP